MNYIQTRLQRVTSLDLVVETVAWIPKQKDIGIGSKVTLSDCEYPDQWWEIVEFYGEMGQSKVLEKQGFNKHFWEKEY